MLYLWPATAFIVLSASSAEAATWTVDDDGPADFDNIQAAITASSDGDVITVAPGTYVGSGDQVVDMLGKDITLRSSDGAEATIIDGSFARRGVVCDSGESLATIIEGFTIRNGLAGQAAGFLGINSTPTVRDCRIENCNATTSGAGIALNDCPALFERCTITGNHSAGSGGGVLMSFSHATFIECTISSNYSGANGGGIWADQCEFSMADCVLSQNTAVSDGAGIYMSGHFVEPSLEGCTLTANAATGWWADGGGIYTYECKPVFTDCIITDNTVAGGNGRGGAVACNNSHASLVGCTLANNVVTGAGGGLWIYECDPSLAACVIENNEAVNGGGVYCEDHADAVLDACRISGNQAVNGGGVMCIQFSRPHLVACLVEDNLADQNGGGVWSSTNGCNPAASHSSFCHNLPTHIDGWSWQDLGGNCFADTCVDINEDGLPDECQCLSDINDDGAVTIDDILALLSKWGCTNCPDEDLNADGIVDIDDLLAIMANWGNCPV